MAKMKADGSFPSASGPRTLLVTCDQVVVHSGRILEKPESNDECRSYIRCGMQVLCKASRFEFLSQTCQGGGQLSTVRTMSLTQ